MTQSKAKDVDSYIAAAPEAARPILRQLRRIITTAVPEAEETISYGMPFYRYHGRLAYFAAHKDKHHFTGRFTSCPAARPCPASA